MQYGIDIVRTSPVAKWDFSPEPQNFWGNHFIAIFDRYDGPD